MTLPRRQFSTRFKITLSALVVLLTHVLAASTSERPRLLVLTDIGGDPDDQQSMVRLMVYSNEFEIEGLIATASGTPGELKCRDHTTRSDPRDR